MVDIICDKMSESGDNDTSTSGGQAGGSGGGVGTGAGGPNYRGGPSAGATRLTSSGGSNSDNQSCQC